MKVKGFLGRFTKLLGYIIGIIVVISILWVIISNVLTIIEKKNNLPIGKIVDVEGKKMHVFVKGDGEDTIVLLSGLGTTAPVIDFMPLADELANNYRVAVVENFGYGWSDQTDQARTIENIVEETRAALQKAEIYGPYILMPHSVSGIYSMYYATTYPEEVKAIIGIDCTMPNQVEYFEGTYPKVPKLMAWLAPTGIARLALFISPNSYLPIVLDENYSAEELKLIKMISSWGGYNQNVVAEMNEVKNNVDKTINLSYAKELPVLIFTRERSNKREDGKTMVSLYETYLNDLNSSKIVLLEGNHYLHWTCSKQMANVTNDFVTEFLK